MLFSGGIDSVFLTLLLHRCLLRVGSTERVDLLNVSFDSGSGAGAPDRLAAVVALAEIRALCPERQWKLVRDLAVTHCCLSVYLSHACYHL